MLVPRGWSLVVLLLSLQSLPTSLGVVSCDRSPYNTQVDKLPGDNGYKISVSGDIQKYIPGDSYTISLQAMRIHYTAQKFIGFMLVVDSGHASYSNIYGPQSVGTFQLNGNVMTMHSEDCANAVIQTSNTPKSQVQVRWTAPPSGSGCVVFRAMVQESRDAWYMDDGELTKEFCEEVHETLDPQPEKISECCACDEAKYEVTFEGLWTRQTHPKDFPANEWLTHFSDIIGASHSNDYRMWEYGELASDGLRQVAEWGSTRTLESELKAQSDHIRTIIKARGLWYPNVNGKTFAVFRVDSTHHLMSLVSMLGPSPDWIVGVSALELCLKNCSWMESQTINLYPYDAGTDSGVTYMSANLVTIPRQVITKITNSDHNFEESPFFDARGFPMKPLAKLTVTRQRVYEKSCSDTPYSSHSRSPYPDEDVQRPECATTEWSTWSPCSVTCANGLTSRTRSFQNPNRASIMQCRRQLDESEMCEAPIAFCEGGDVHNIFGGSNYFDESVCTTSSWSPWGPCSVTCGEGIIMRNRYYLDRMGRKKCNEEIVQKEICKATQVQCPEEPENVDEGCKVSFWTDWSPCSVTCGLGTHQRTRTYLVPSTTRQHQCNVRTLETRECNGLRRDCAIDPSEAREWDGNLYHIRENGELEADCTAFAHLNISVHNKIKYMHWCELGKERRARQGLGLNEVCVQEKMEGPCRAYFTRWYYDTQQRMCMKFNFGGCAGNRNNFKRYEDCIRLCEQTRDDGSFPNYEHTSSDAIGPYSNDHYLVGSSHSPTDAEGSNRHNGLVAANQSRRVDCLVTPWSEWSNCNVTCGRGKKFKTREIIRQPEFGGRPCPRKLTRARVCRLRRCPHPSDLPNNGLQSFSLTLDEDFVPDAHQRLQSQRQPFTATPDPEVEFEREFNGSPDSDCVMGDWSAWTPCNQSCGPEALQQRARSIVSKPRGSGMPCGARLERRFCSLPPCLHNRG